MATLIQRTRNLAVLPICALICACSSSNFKEYIVDTPTTATAAAPAAPAARSARATAPARNAAVTRTPESTAGVTAPSPVSRTGCDRGKAVSVGMTASDVYASCWGRPRNVNTSVVGSTKVETLFYDGYNYIYMENGIVKSVETSAR